MRHVRHTVLVVEDNTDVRDAVIAAVETAGHAAIGAENGRRALELLRSRKFDACLILLDLMMPVMDGWQFRAQQLRDPELGTIPVVVFTAFRDAGRTARALGAVAGLQKPVDPDELLHLVDEHCSA